MATQNFDYTGNIQSFTCPISGVYKLEVWGASGGGYTAGEGSRGGYGGYSCGYYYLQKNQVLYVVVGGQGNAGADPVHGYQVSISGGYNGGGKAITWVDSKTCGGGGGATHIAKVSGVLSSLSSQKDSILIVAGGGGGGGKKTQDNCQGGDAGGYAGDRGVAGSNDWTGTGGTQTSGASFGQGGNASAGNTSGGGGGWYGGNIGTGNGGYGGGGSSYIGNPGLFSLDSSNRKATYGYTVSTSSDESTYTISTSNVSSIATPLYAKQGNGYARISFVFGNGGNRGYIIAR